MIDQIRQLLYVGCATQQQPTSAGTRSDPSRRARSRVARVQQAKHTRTRLLHVFNTSFTRLNVSRYTLSTWTVAQPPQQSRTVQVPDSSLSHHYALITRYLCFHYASITSFTRGIASITRVASPLRTNYVHKPELPELQIDGAYSKHRCQLGQTANFVKPKHTDRQQQFLITLTAS